MVAGFCVASVYAVGMLRGRRDRYHRLGLLIPLTVAVIATPVQIGVGDWIANVVAEHQPVKLAAMEGHFRTDEGVALAIGGIYVDDELRYAIKVPRGLSLLVHHDPNAEVIGLDSVAAEDRPPVNIVHLSYNAMVGIGFGAARARRLVRLRVVAAPPDLPDTPWFLRAVAVSGLAAVVAMETGWIATEVGRQPWIVYEVHAHRRRREHRARPAVRVLRRVRRLRRADRRIGVRAAPAGRSPRGEPRAAGADRRRRRRPR